MTSLSRLRAFVRDVSGPASFGTTSYSQEGEDLVLDRLLGGKSHGCYVEVGCHHPFRFSNTYLFYKRGWRGICIDPLPGTAKLFRKWRPRDIALEIAVASQPAVLQYHMFNEPALNTFDPALAAQRNGLKSFRIIGQRAVDVVPLRSVLAEHAELSDGPIDFFSVDVEGLDLDVLRSNDWDRFRPTAVVAEAADFDLSAANGDPIVDFMRSVGYAAYAKTGLSVIFTRQ